MTRARRVIVGASGSPGSLPALRQALWHARRDDATLIAVAAWTPPGGDRVDRCAPCAELRRSWEKAALDKLMRSLDAAWGGPVPAGPRVQVVVQRGDAGPVLVGIADSGEDLLVVGAGRRGLLGRIFGGRVSRYCLAHAGCPVLAVPPSALAREAGHGRSSGRHQPMTADEALRAWDHRPA